MWHVSIARWKSTLIPTDRWGDGTLRDAKRVAMGILNGVGTGESVETLHLTCLHIRRSLSPAEMEALSAEWLAIPARDEFSQDGTVESRL